MKTKKILAAIVALTIVASAVPTQPFANVINEMTITASAEEVTYNAEYNINEDSVIISQDGTYRIYGDGTTVTNTITVSADVSAKITLENVNIDASAKRDGCAFKIEDNSTGNVTVTLVGSNSLKSGENCAGLQKNGTGEEIGTLTIGGLGTLDSYGGTGIGGALNYSSDNNSCSNIVINGGIIKAIASQESGIGGGYNGNGENITINGGILFAKGKVGAGIGGGYEGNGSNITINGGIVSSSSSMGAGIGGGIDGTGNNIIINDGSVIAKSDDGCAIGGGDYNNQPVTPKNSNGDFVYPLIIENPDNETVYIDGVEYPANHSALDENDKNLYAYATATVHTVVVGSTVMYYSYNPTSRKFEKIDNVEIGTNFTVSATNQEDSLVSGTDYTYYKNPDSSATLTILSSKPITISGSSVTDTIVVASGVSANITLKDVDIDASSKADLIGAFTIADDSKGNVSVELIGTNTLKGSPGAAGLQKNGFEDVGTLSISGSGTLLAIGGKKASGLGGGFRNGCSNIIINDGYINAIGGEKGAGIGGGELNSYNINTKNNITINGGIVTAKGGDYSCGIGNGLVHTDSTDDESLTNVTINGGSVKAIAGSSSYAIGEVKNKSKYPVTPVDSDGNELYLFEIPNPDEETVTINGNTYPVSHSDEDKKIYAYLPAKSADSPNVVRVGTSAYCCYYDESEKTWCTFVFIPDVDSTVFTYDGNEQTYDITENELYTVSDNKQTDAGTYTVTVSLNDKTNYIWSDGTTEDKKYSFTISSKVITSSDLKFVDSIIEKTYDGSASSDAKVQIKAGIVGADAEEIGGTAVYNSENVNNASKVTFTPDAVTSGNFTIDVSEAIEHEASITAKVIEPVVDIIGEYTYSADAITPEITVKYGETVLIYGIDYILEFSGNTNAGNAIVTVKSVDNGNYYFIDTNKEFIINKATPSYTVPTTLTAKCGDKLSTVTLPSGFEWTSEDVALEAGTDKADGQSVTKIAKYVPEDKTNYNDVEDINISITVTHTKSTTSNSNGTHSEKCNACDYERAEVACSGGTATCSEKAKCSVCEGEYGELDPTNHKFTTYTSDQDATCLVDGHKSATCDYGCGNKDTVVDEGSNLGHNYKPTFTWSEDGKTCSVTLTCDRASCTDKTDGYSVNHDCTVTSAVKKAATCIAKGTTTYTATYDTYTDTKDVVDIEKVDHTWDAGKVTTAATCKEKGVKTFKCTVDGCTGTKTEEIAIDASNHVNTEVVGEKDATCTEKGYTGDTHCKDCDETVTGTEIQATGHDMTKTISGKVPATCEVDGKEAVMGCKNCDHEEGGAVIPAKGHTWDAGTVTTPATCKEKGVKTFKCTVEGCTGTKTEDIAIDENNHVNTEVVGKKDATCTEKGYTGDTCCKDCEKTISEGTEIAATGHKWDSGKVTKEATVSEKGVKTFTCTNPGCNGTKTESIAKLPEPKKNAVIEDKTGNDYKVLDPAKKEVAYKAPASKKAKTVTIPANVTIDGITYKVTKIEDKAFKGNTTVTKITIPSSVTVIGAESFSGCKKLKTVSVPKNVTQIGKNAFKGCAALTKITLPSKCTKIGANAFDGCKKMKTITIKGAKLTSKSVSANAFKGLSKNVTIKVPKKQLKAYKKLLKKKGFKGKVKA